MQLTETQNKIFAILFAAGEPLDAGRLGEAIGLTPEEAPTLGGSLFGWRRGSFPWSSGGWTVPTSFAPSRFTPGRSGGPWSCGGTRR